jgi:hypothetical protein
MRLRESVGYYYVYFVVRFRFLPFTGFGGRLFHNVKAHFGPNGAIRQVYMCVPATGGQHPHP